MNIVLIIILLIIFTLIFSFVWKVTKAVFRLALFILFIILIVSFITVSIDDVVQVTNDTDLPFKEMVNDTFTQVKNATHQFINPDDEADNITGNMTDNTTNTST